MIVTISFSEILAYLLTGAAVALLLVGVGFEIFDADKRRYVPQNRFLRLLRWFAPSLLCFEDRKDMQSLCRFTAVISVVCILISAYMMQRLCDITELSSGVRPWHVYAVSVGILTWSVYVVTMIIKLALTLLKVIISFIKGE